VSSRDVDAPPFWAKLRGSGKRVAVIDAPETYPIAGLEGIQICDWSNHETRHKPSANPESLLQDARKEFGAPYVIEQHPNNSIRQDNNLLPKYIDRIRRTGRLFRHLLTQGQFDLIVVGFGESHTGGYQFWHHLDKPEDEVGVLGHAIRDIYAAIDDEFGRLLEQRGGETTNVVLFGAIGISDSYPTNVILETMLRKFGYLRDITGAGGTRPLDLARRPISDAFLTCIDWPNTQAYYLPPIHNSIVRVNLRGREPQGIAELERNTIRCSIAWRRISSASSMRSTSSLSCGR
jgi:predicted AlkP superfamily phosphohydrolase/phosphomutase